MPDTTDTNPVGSFWQETFDWPFKRPPTRDFMREQQGSVEGWHLLALNESPWALKDDTAEYLAEVLPDLNRYPDNLLSELSAAVAKETGVPSERQVWGAGASDLINRAIALATQHQLNVVSPAPTFWGYERTYRLHDAQVTRTPLDRGGRIDVNALLSAVDTETGIVTFATPGNPSGVSLTAEEIETIARDTPDDVLLMIDEVYHEFCVHEGGPNALDIVRRVRRGPWVVIRSFSKAYRLAGARIGYALASDNATAKRLQEHSLNFSVSSLSFAVALAAWRDQSGLMEYLESNQVEKQFLSSTLEQLGLQALLSSANFVSVELPLPAVQVLGELRQKKIACAPWNHPGFPNHIRIGLGERASSHAVIAALSDILP